MRRLLGYALSLEAEVGCGRKVEEYHMHAFRVVRAEWLHASVILTAAKRAQCLQGEERPFFFFTLRRRGAAVCGASTACLQGTRGGMLCACGGTTCPHGKHQRFSLPPYSGGSR